MDRKIRLSRAQERRTATAIGGVLQPRSGAGDFRKGDVRTPRNQGQPEELLIENKRTDNLKSITLRATDLNAVWQHAAAEGRVPVLGFELAGQDYYVVRQDDLIEMRRVRDVRS